LPWLAALLVIYLLSPLGAFGARLAGTPRSQLSVPGAGSALAISVETASISAVIIAVLGVPLAYLLARPHGRAAGLLGIAVQLPIALPPLMSGILLLYIVGPYSPIGMLTGGRLTDDMTGIVLAQVFVAAPFLIVNARSAFAAIDPALPDVAATLGHGRWSRFTKVELPGASVGIGAGLLLAWLRAFGEFGATVVLAYHPYSLPVFTYVQFSSTGLPATIFPVAITLATAFAVLAIGYYVPRLRRPRRYAAEMPGPRQPESRPSPRLAFDLDARLGTFQLRVAHAARGAHLAILGPSGAGKTLTLRLLAGLVQPATGFVRLGTGGTAADPAGDLTFLPAERRGVGYLPQEASLIPHLPVWQQATFGTGTDPALAAHWMDRLHLNGLENRLPAELSGGQRRRVALARALARDPRLLLLDEPFTGLDTPVRDELRRELRRLQQETALATVLVTHDPEEAALLADEVLIVADGRLLQAGPQRAVFSHPGSPEAARLLGIRNLHPARVATRTALDVDGTVIEVPPLDLAPGTEVTWCIRPEDIRVVSAPPAGDGPPAPGGPRPPEAGALEAGALHPATVTDVIHLGAVTELVLALANGYQVTAVQAADGAPSPGSACALVFPPDAITIWPATATARTPVSAAT
jgi:ABC-type sulfate/molybdate transport systems ATPase subunit/ABC-type sulfate transport system permease component